MLETEAERATLVAFEVGGVTYALDTQHVRQIVRPLALQVLPHAPSTIAGVVDHRGEVVPILDLRVRFAVSSPTQTRETRWILIDRGAQLIGLVVDSVSDVFALRDTEPRQVPELGAGREARGIASALSYHGRLVFVIDVERIVEPARELRAPALPGGSSEAR